MKFNVPEGSKAVWQEFGPAKFRRSLRLGAAVDPARVEAIYRNGLLLVTMPKAEHAKPRQIRVQVAARNAARPSAKQRVRTKLRPPEEGAHMAPSVPMASNRLATGNPTTRVVVGLGNAERQYQYTRHNVGARAVTEAVVASGLASRRPG